jgi:uncharacterized protein YpbB
MSALKDMQQELRVTVKSRARLENSFSHFAPIVLVQHGWQHHVSKEVVWNAVKTGDAFEIVVVGE